MFFCECPTDRAARAPDSVALTKGMANQTNHKNTEGSSTTLQPATGWEEETGGDICARPQGKPALQRPLRFLHARRCARVCLHVCAHTCMCVRVWELGITPGSYSCASLKEKNPGADHEQPQTTRLLQPTLLPPTFLHRCPQLGPNGSRFFRRALPLPQNSPCLPHLLPAPLSAARAFKQLTSSSLRLGV